MITIFRGSKIHTVTPTIFPDGTSQVWKLPEWALEKQVHVTWNFEQEREIIDLLSLSKLVSFTVINIPYLPYARQDKDVFNTNTFNLFTLRDLLWLIDEDVKVRSFDVHNPKMTETIFFGQFQNQDVRSFHKHVYQTVQPTYLVFPDKGAAERYLYLKKNPHIIFEKVRDQATGQILSLKMLGEFKFKPLDKFLIVDDLCDYGGTFCGVSEYLHDTIGKDITVDLCVTHGLFSGGKEILYKKGINKIFTTNSLLRNNGEGVFEL
jgi:ribose-phosphate pyrophosphokinase